MHGYRFSAALRIWHPSADPDEIERRLALKATHKTRAGVGRSTPQGDPLEGEYSTTYCCFDLECNESEGLTSVLQRTNEHLRAHGKFLIELSDSGGRLEYFVGLFFERNAGENLNWSLLADMAALRLSLDIDFYPPKNSGK